MARPAKLAGIFTPNIVPLDAHGEINEPELRRYTDWLIERGVHGLYPNGSTGEFTRFTPEERRRIIAIMADQTRGRVPILAGAAEANIRETITACEYYHGLGVRAVAIVSPFYYKLSPDAVYAYFKEIGDNTPVDVTLYNIPMFASPIDVPTVQRLSEECERDRGDQGFVGRLAAHDPHDPGRAAQPARLHLPDRLGCGPDADAADRLRRRHERHQRRRARDHAQAVRPDRWPARSTRPASCNTSCVDAVRRDDSTRPIFPKGFARRLKLRGIEAGESRQPYSQAQH